MKTTNEIDLVRVTRDNAKETDLMKVTGENDKVKDYMIIGNGKGE